MPEDTPIRVRFAPSPTGALHIGGARTALYNWLAARHGRGELVLRIEDTDRDRSTEENVAQILDAMEWLELDWDVGPVSQAGRADLHAEALQRLLDSGAAYRDSATAKDVEAWKAEHGAERGYRGKPVSGEGAAVRLRVPEEGETVVHDLIRGPVSFPNRSYDDFVVARGDGSVLYNFAVAVDDAEMGITEVVRGDDHLSNTPKQLLVLTALGHEPPRYAHLPLLHGPDGKKLSKRHGAASVQELRDAGFLPEAVRNYLALLGWGDADDETIIPTDELVARFELERVQRNPARFDEKKLRWMNGRYIRALPVADLQERLEGYLRRDGELGGAVFAAREKIQTLADFWPLVGPIYDGPVDDPKAREQWLDEDGRAAVAAAREVLAEVSDWDTDHLDEALKRVIEQRGAKPKDVFQPIRVAVVGRTVSPGIYETLELLGRDEALRRMDAALDGE